MRTNYTYIIYLQYVDWVRTGDLQAEWEYEPACRQYAYKADSDLFKGAFLSNYILEIL